MHSTENGRLNFSPVQSPECETGDYLSIVERERGTVFLLNVVILCCQV